MLEIAKLLTLSTAHITPETAKRLEAFCNPGLRHTRDACLWLDGIVVYEKSEYGWFIYCGDAKDDPEKFDALPADLAYLIDFALTNDCLWLCLDRDGDVVDDLVSYDW